MPYLEAERRIFYRCWDCPGAAADVIFLHGAGEHSGLYHRLATALNAAGYRVWALDHPGHGLTPGTSEDVYDVSVLAGTARALMEFVARSGAERPVLIGNSLGGVTAAWLMSQPQPPEIAGLILSATPLEPLRDIDKLAGAVMSREPTYLDLLASDPLLRQNVPLDYHRLDAGMTRAAEQIKRRMPQWPFPVLMINGECDVLARPENARHLSATLRRGRTVMLRSSHHDVLNDIHHAAAERLIVQFLFETTDARLIFA